MLSKKPTTPAPCIDADRLEALESRLATIEAIHRRELAGARADIEHRAQAAHEQDRRRAGEARRRELLAKFISAHCIIEADARESSHNISVAWALYADGSDVPGFGVGELARDLCMLAGGDVKEGAVRTTRPSRSTVTVSASRKISSRRCDT